MVPALFDQEVDHPPHHFAADAAARERVADEDVDVGVAVVGPLLLAPLHEAGDLAVDDDREPRRLGLVEREHRLHRSPPARDARLLVQLTQRRYVARVQGLELDLHCAAA